MKRMAVEGMRERGQFPGAHVSGEKKNALAAAAGGVEILKAVENYDTLDIFAGVSRELGKLAHHPAHLAHHAANHLPAMGVIPIRKS